LVESRFEQWVVDHMLMVSLAWLLAWWLGRWLACWLQGWRLACWLLLPGWLVLLLLSLGTLLGTRCTLGTQLCCSGRLSTWLVLLLLLLLFQGTQRSCCCCTDWTILHGGLQQHY
jgi:hypothetical protein